jgi:SAM-dependent methyltransferase
MSAPQLTEHRDAWIASKQVRADEIAQIKTRVSQDVDAALWVARQARELIGSANDMVTLYAAIDALAVATRRLSTVSHWAKFGCDWLLPPMPEFNDHFVNQYYLLTEYKRTFWLEGAVFSGLSIQAGQRILDLCCGTGWYTDHFYSPFAPEIVAVDFDPRAIEIARRFHQLPNIKYEVIDIRERLPAGPFGTVIWDGSIEHFTEQEIDSLMPRIRALMAPGAKLAGYTVAEPANSPELPTHETHFSGPDHVARILRRHFKNVSAFERIHPTLSPPRHNPFFYASDEVLPFDPGWEHGVRL